MVIISFMSFSNTPKPQIRSTSEYRVLYEQSYVPYFWISRTDENTLKTNPGTALFCTYVQGVGVRGPADEHFSVVGIIPSVLVTCKSL